LREKKYFESNVLFTFVKKKKLKLPKATMQEKFSSPVV